jgi:UDP-N-acetyl-D-mannosaminuronic acid dehydrogenase
MGLGYIGFPTACLVAKAGHKVVGVDVNKNIVNKLRNGGLHIVNEPGLEDLAREVLQTASLQVSTVPEAADVFIISVPTPFKAKLKGQDHFVADCSYVASATAAIAPYVKPGNLVVLESTVPPHTTENVVMKVLQERGVDTAALLFAHAPERVLPGAIVHELVHNARIIGGLTPEATTAAANFYRSFVVGDVMQTDATTAELVKLMENTYRDVNIALANEFAQVCEYLGVDIWEAIQLANRHPRVNYMRPGPGVGGHCIAVDPYFVVEAAPHLTPLVQTARRINTSMPHHVVDLFEELTKDAVIENVVVLGASYKGNVGDDRESPSLEVAEMLKGSGYSVRVHDPFVEPYVQPLETALKDADAVLLLTDHGDYGRIDPHAAARLVRKHFVLDARGMLNRSAWQEAGFSIIQLGTGASAGGRVAVPAVK